MFVSVLTDLSVSTTPVTTTSASPPVSPPVRSTSVSPPQTPPAASLSVPPVLVIVLGVVLLLLLVPLLILIQQNRVMRRGRRDPETVILCLIQCVISHVLWTDSSFVCLHSQLSLRGDTGRRLRPFMRRFSTDPLIDTVFSLRGVSKHLMCWDQKCNHFTKRGKWSKLHRFICGILCVSFEII